MQKFEHLFPTGIAFTPVIHVRWQDQVEKNIRIALDEGADGVFLIGHGMEAKRLDTVYRGAREKFHHAWIGMNYLDLSARIALATANESVNAIWTDDAGIDESQKNIAHEAAQIWDELQYSELKYRGLNFGGVAFKYQQPVRDLAAVARAVEPYVDVLTTSGKATGSAPAVEKIKTIRSCIAKPIGIASGLTSENVGEFLTFAPLACLVATSITDRTNDVFIPERIRSFAKALGR